MTEGKLADWRLVAGSALALLVGNGPIMQFTFGVLLKPIEAEFGVGRGTASLVLTLGLLATALALPFAGQIADRTKPKVFSLLAVFGFGLLLIMTGLLSHSIGALALLVFLTGLLAAGHTPLPFVRLISARFDRRRGLALACCLTGIGIGAAIVPVALQHVVSQFGWRGGYVFLGVAVWTVAGISVLTSMPSTMPDHAKQVQRSGSDAERQYLRDPTFWLMLLSVSLTALCANGIIAHLVPMMSDRGIGPGEAAEVIIWIGAATVLGRFLGGLLLDRFWAPGVAIVFVAAMAGGILLLLGGIKTEHFAIVAFILGFGLGVEADLVGFLVSRYFPLERFGELFGLMFGAFMLANSAGPLALGMMYSASGSYDIGLKMFALCLIIACFLFSRLGGYRFATQAGALPQGH